jgi:hypothetical protein
LKSKFNIDLLQEILNLEVGRYNLMSFSFWHKLVYKKEESVSLQQFIESLCILIYRTIFNSKLFNNEMEVYLSVALITLNKSDVSVYELSRNKSFTNDIGID